MTALIVVIGVMTGMQEDLRGKILSSAAHVLVLQQGSSLRMDRWRDVAEDVRQVEGVVSVSPFVITSISIVRTGYTQPADLYGLQLDANGPPVTDMEADIQQGVLNLQPPASGLPPILMGSRLAIRMGLFPGDTLTVIAFENLRFDPMGVPTPTMRQFEVTGTFTTGMYDYDIRNVYVSIQAAQELLDMSSSDQVSGLGVRTDDEDRALEVTSEIQDRLGFGYIAESWITQNRALFSALKLEKLAMGLILGLIVVVAAFNIVGMLVMVVVDRTREIGILKSMGMTNRGVLHVFMLQGLWIGVIGTAVGTAAGLTLSWLIDRYEIIPIPPEVYFVDRLPVSLRATDVLLIVGVSILISFFATIYPALRASRLEPVDAIRHECPRRAGRAGREPGEVVSGHRWVRTPRSAGGRPKRTARRGRGGGRRQRSGKVHVAPSARRSRPANARGGLPGWPGRLGIGSGSSSRA